MHGVIPTLDELLRLRAQAPARGFKAQIKAASALAGGFTSAFRGRGVQFEEVRAYQAGDDIRDMDWRVFARTGQPHTKIFREERERPVFFLVDHNPSMAFGTRHCFKSVTAARATALLAWSAMQSGDRVGGLIFGPGFLHPLPPTSGERGVLPLLAALTRASSRPQEGPPHPLTQALTHLERLTHPGNLIFLLSDFLTLTPETQRHLRHLRRHHDLVMIHIHDPLEAELPALGRRRFILGETVVTVATHDPRVRAAHAEAFQQRQRELARFCRENAILHITLGTHEPLSNTLFTRLHPLWHRSHRSGNTP